MLPWRRIVTDSLSFCILEFIDNNTENHDSEEFWHLLWKSRQYSAVGSMTGLLSYNFCLDVMRTSPTWEVAPSAHLLLLELMCLPRAQDFHSTHCSCGYHIRNVHSTIRKEIKIKCYKTMAEPALLRVYAYEKN